MQGLEDIEVVLGKDQPQYLPLPAIYLDTPSCAMITRWRLSAQEREANRQRSGYRATTTHLSQSVPTGQSSGSNAGCKPETIGGLPGMISRRGFLSLLGGAATDSTTKYFLPPIGGWKSDVIAKPTGFLMMSEAIPGEFFFVMPEHLSYLWWSKASFQRCPPIPDFSKPVILEKGVARPWTADNFSA